VSHYRAAWHGQLHAGVATPGQVESLLDSLPQATVFNSVPWCQAAVQALPPPRTLHMLAVSDAGGLAAWLPMSAGVERIHGLPLRTLRLLGHPYNDRVALPLRGGDGELAGTVVEALRSCPWAWDVVVLSELHSAAERGQLARALAAQPALGVEWRACSSTPVLGLADGVPADRGRSATARSARARRKLAAAGTMRFERLIPTPAQVPPLLALCKAIEDRSWKGMQGLGIFSTPAGARFFADAATRLAARGWLDIGLLYLDGQPISYRFGFRHRNVWLDFNLAYDPAYAACAPGRILLDEMILSSRQQGLDAVDASRSSRTEPHLLAEWSDARIEHHELWLFAPTLRGRLLGLARRHLRPALQRLRRRAGA
jgi:CelD/BcsL family acetyltransferase involved in cellulose biosynthesis